MNYTPDFPHAHYHSYDITNHSLANINDVLLQRVEDIAAVCHAIGARSILDVGSNYGGLVFYLEKLSLIPDVCGLDANAGFVDECRKVGGMINSRARFQKGDVMTMTPPASRFDAILLQNVYHYIFDAVGNHETIFRKLVSLGRSIVWYNPISADDPVIQQHANKNNRADGSNYTRPIIFDAAIKAGFLHPIPLTMRFNGMGAAREHWLFVADTPRPLSPRHIPISEIGGVEQKLFPHYEGIHRVLIDSTKSYKIFLDRRGQVAALMRAMEVGILDEAICGPILDFIVDGTSVVGYSQPRGMSYPDATKLIGDYSARAHHRRAVWRLVSRMLKSGAFNHDIGRNNFVFAPFRAEPIMIDVEGFTFDGESLSLNHKTRTQNEIRGTEANLKNVFPEADVSVHGRNTGEILRNCMQKPFLQSVPMAGALA